MLADKCKRAIKRHPWGLYLVERRKRALYRRYMERYTDEAFVSWLYKRRLGRTLDLRTPRLFTEKLQWLKLYYRDERMIRCSDKYEVKGYLAEHGFGELAVPTLAVYDSAEAIDAALLPTSFVLKATHGSGWNIVCRDKQTLNMHHVRRMAAIWLSQSAYVYGREWNYAEQTPRLIAEPLLSDRPLVDYKFMCFHGEVRAVQVNREQDGVGYVDLYDAQWRLWEDTSTGVAPHSETPLPKPTGFERMKEIARALSEPFAFVRIDLYEIEGRILLGEMTFFPGSGFWNMTPLSRDRMLGEWLTLPEKNYGFTGE